MGGLFSSGRKSKKESNEQAITEKDKAVLELKRMRDRLRKYREGLTNIIQRETQYARELIDNGQRKKAVLVLKKKKLQESLAEKAQGQLYNIETMLTQIETAALNQQIFQAMKVGQATLAQLQKEMSIEDVEELMQETAESVAMQQRLSDTLGASLTPEESTSVEEEVDRMLAEMKKKEEEQKQQSKAKLPAVADEIKQQPKPVVGEEDLAAQVQQLPDVPSTRPESVEVTSNSAPASPVAVAEEEEARAKEVVLN